MPGYTHMQLAMPSSIKMWATSFIDALSDYEILLDSIKKIMNQSPLGSAAGFGVPLDIDKEFTAKELGFEKVQSNPMYCQLSRGNFESQFLSVISGIMHIFNKISSDLILFSMPHFGYFFLPKELTTGSSIMPNKKNPDVLEILRANYNVVLGKEFEIKNIIGNLISGYNRDIQLTKKPMFEAIEILENSLDVVTLLFAKLEVNEDNCKKWMLPELYATEEAYNLVKQGKSFREAYKEVGQKFV
jgi:argininosuccinate lyase